jgi:hypothetical protein
LPSKQLATGSSPVVDIGLEEKKMVVKKSSLHKLLVSFISKLVTTARENRNEVNWDVTIPVVNDRKVCFNSYVKLGEAGYIIELNMDGVNGKTMRISKVLMHDQEEIAPLFIDQFIDDVEMWVNREMGISQ